MSKIFVTVGNTIHSFDRLIKSIDNVQFNKKINFTVQYGYSKYIPENIKNTYKFINRNEFYRIFNNSDLIISHAGIGTTIDCIRNRKKMIMVPRMYKYNEHFNDHQLEIAKEIENKYENIKIVYNISNLKNDIFSLLNKDVKYPTPPNLKSLPLVCKIKEFIQNEKEI